MRYIKLEPGVKSGAKGSRYLLRVCSALQLSKVGAGINGTKKNRLVLVHASIGEQKGRVRQGDDRGRRYCAGRCVRNKGGAAEVVAEAQQKPNLPNV